MSHKLNKQFSIGCCVVSLTALLLIGGLAPAFAGDGPQDGFGNGNSIDQSYDQDSRVVTVSTGDEPGNKSGGNSGGGSKDDPAERCTGASNPCSQMVPKSGEPAEVARRAVAQLALPANVPVFGPLPTQNQWGIIPVGYPVWLWTSSTDTQMAKTVSQDGLTIALTAARQSIVFNLGDGQHVTCAKPTPRPAQLTGDPLQPSPTCGHIYQTTGTFTITATTHWAIAWQTDHESGSFTVTDTASAETLLPIGELRTAITDNQPPR